MTDDPSGCGDNAYNAGYEVGRRSQTVDVIRIEVAKLELGPADVLVLRCDQELSQEELDALHDQAMIASGIDRVLILDKHFEIVVVKDPCPHCADHDRYHRWNQRQHL